MSFEKIRLKSWAEIDQYARPGWIYRGQSSCESSLMTSLERCCMREKLVGSKRSLMEQKLLRQFRRAYHHYSSHVPSPSHTLEWLSLMQHHGAPTRLLDFTYSIYVAAYFALEGAREKEEDEQDRAVWLLNFNWALDESIALMKNAGKDKADMLKEFYEETHMAIVPDFFFKAPSVPSVCPQNPFRLAERLRIQKGVFVIPGSIELPFEENVRAMPGYNVAENFVKLIIPHGVRREALRRLFDMNISRTSLFPGLDGFSQALGVYDPDYPKP